MEPVSLKPQMSELLSAHGVPFHQEGEWLLPYAELPAIRTGWLAGENSGRLDAEVLLPDNRIIHECFAGLGSEQQGINDALQNFTVNSFHVLLAAFWGINDSETVTTKEWVLSGKPYTAYVGHIGARGSAESDAVIPESFMDAIESAVKAENSLMDTQWYRSFFCNVAEQHTFEALENNEPWKSGDAALRALPWEKSAGYFSVRNFMVLRHKV